MFLFVLNQRKENKTSSGKQRERTDIEEASVQNILMEKKFCFLDLHLKV